MIKLYKLTDYLSDRRVAIDFISEVQRESWLANYQTITFGTHQYIKNLGHQALTITVDFSTIYGVDFLGVNYMMVYNSEDLGPSGKKYFYYIDRIDWKGDAQATLFCSYDAFMNLYSVYNLSDFRRRVASTDWSVITKRHFDRFTEENVPVIQDVAQSQQFTQEQKSKAYLGSSTKTYLGLRTFSEDNPISIWDVFYSTSTSVTVTAYPTIYENFVSDTTLPAKTCLKAGDILVGKYYNDLTKTIVTWNRTVASGHYITFNYTPGSRVLNALDYLDTGGFLSTLFSYTLPASNTSFYLSVTGEHIIADASVAGSDITNVYGLAIGKSGTTTGAVYSVEKMNDQTYSAIRVLPMLLSGTLLRSLPYRNDGSESFKGHYIEAGATIDLPLTDTPVMPATFDVSRTPKARVIGNDPKLYHSQYYTDVYSFEDQTIEQRWERFTSLDTLGSNSIYLVFSSNGMSSAMFKLANSAYIPVNENDVRKVFSVNNSIAIFSNAMNDWTNNFKDIDDSLYKQRESQAMWGTAISAGMQIAGIIALGAATGGAGAVALGAKVAAGVIGVGGSLYNANNAVTQNRLSYERQKEQLLQSTISLSGSPVDLSNYDSQYRIKHYKFGLKTIDYNLLDDLFFYEGYECAERSPIERLIISRNYFNYIKADVDFVAPSDFATEDNYEITPENIDSLKSRFASGLTIFHCKLGGGMPASDITDWDQSQENWETYI